MRTPMIAAILALCACGLAVAQAPTVSLQNQESVTFYYVVDPTDLSGLTAGSPLLGTKVAAFFAAQPDDLQFASLAPDSEVKLSGLADGTHLLVGFFTPEDEGQVPVRVVSLQADSRVGERFYAIFASPAQLTVPRGVGRLAALGRKPATAEESSTAAATQTSAAATAEVADRTSATTEATAKAAAARADLVPIASFSRAYAPESFTRERSDGFAVLPLSASRAWSLTGSRISSVSGVLDGTGLRLALTAPGGFSESVSYFFYVFGARTMGRKNILTLELQPRADGARGACIMWHQGSSTPRVIGTVSSSGTTVEADIPADDVAREILGVGGNGVSVDLTAGWYDRALGTWEEFYYTTFTSDQIPQDIP
jgi:hypothetical protein